MKKYNVFYLFGQPGRMQPGLVKKWQPSDNSSIGALAIEMLMKKHPGTVIRLESLIEIREEI